MPANATVRDLLAGSGLDTLGSDAPLEAVQHALGELRSALDAADPLVRATAREAAIRRVKDAGVSAPGRMVDAALNGAPGGAASVDVRQGSAIALSDPEPWPEPVDGARLLTAIEAAFEKYIALPDGAAAALALWTVLTHAHDAFVVSPLLALQSPTPECGKTRTLDVLYPLVPRPIKAANISAASVPRVVEEYASTLLLDEAGTYLRQNEALRGVLDSGHTRGELYVRTAGDDHEVRTFSTWAPKAIAKIGKLPPTLRGRSVIVRLQRRRPDQTIARLRKDRIEGELGPVCRRAARWTADHADALAAHDPGVPDGMRDRTADNWRPLLSIADLAGGEWPEKARKAAKALLGNADDGEDTRVQLLADLKDLFEEHATDGKVFSKTILAKLTNMDGRPWPEWSRTDKPLSANALAKLLKPFDISSKQVRIGPDSYRGYTCADFEDAFERYLSREVPGTGTKQPKQSSNGARNSGSHGSNTGPDVSSRKPGENPTGDSDVSAVYSRDGGTGEGEGSGDDIDFDDVLPKTWEVPE